ncbi:MAG: hypothetical protein AB1446_10705 [Bacillota bacterium]
MSEEARAQEQKLVELGLGLVEAAREKGVTLRLLGAVAFRVHCPAFKHLEYQVGRWLSDLDFAAYARDLDKLEKIFTQQGFVEDERVKTLHGMERRVFNHESGWHADVFVDRLRFCHDVNFRGRLEQDYPTIPLAELLLEKLQIVAFEPKDAVDTFVLLREHPVGEGDRETVNAPLIARICGDDWGFWKTVNLNLDRMEEYARSLKLQVTEEDRRDVLDKISLLRKHIQDEPKSLKWRMRARLGTRVPWYREVEELSRQ